MSLLSKFKKAASWAFNNNGNVADNTRLRLIDASPIHTTGLRRLGYDWPSIGALGIGTAFICAAVASNSEHLARNTVFAVLGTVSGIAMTKGINRSNLKQAFENHNDLCFNTDPSQSVSSADNLKKADNLASGSMNALWLMLALTALAFPYSSQRMPVSSLILPFLLSEGISDCMNVVHFLKVKNGTWIIEDTPPPKKQPEREPLLGQLNAILPKPVPVQA